MKKAMLFTAASLTALMMPYASAQDADEDVEAEARLDTVTVNARRVEEDLQNVPITITVVESEDFLKKALFEFADLADNTPGLNIDGEAGGINFVSIRGVGNLGTASPLSPSVSVFIDGAAAPDAAFLINSTLDLASVEVLRGPQGTLYGTNATAGAINLYAQEPGLDGSSNAYVEGTYAVFDHNGNNTYELEGATDFTFIEDVLGVRLAGSIRRDEGYINNPFIGEPIGQSEQDNVRAKFVYNHSEAVRAGLTLGYYEGLNQETFVIDVQSELGGGIFSPPPFFQELDLFDFKSSQEPAKNPEKMFYSVLDVDVDTPLGDLTSITSFFKQDVNVIRDGDNNGFLQDSVDFDFDGERFSQEVRLAGEAFGGNLSYLIGGYYAKSDRDRSAVTDFTDSGRIPIVINDPGGGTEREFLSLFTNNTYDVTDRLSISLGARVEKTEAELVDPFVDISATVLALALGQTPVGGVTIDSDDETNVATSVKATYRVNDNLTLFGAYDQAYRNGSWNVGAADVFVDNGLGQFDTETTDAFEIGFKSSGWFNNRLKLNGAAYFQTFEDYQYQDFSPTVFVDVSESVSDTLDAFIGLTPGTLAFLGFPQTDAAYLALPTAGLVFGVPKAENKGFELEFDFDVTDNWYISGSVSTNDFRFEDADSVPTNPINGEPPITFDGRLSQFGFGRLYAGAGGQAALDAVDALSGNPPGTTPITGDIVNLGTLPTRSRTGIQISNRPMSYSIASEYRSELNLFGQNEAFIRGVFSHVDVDSEVSPTLKVPYDTLNLFAGLQGLNDEWSVQLYATNVLNEEYARNVVTDINRPAGPRARPAAPRQIGVTVRKNF